MKVGYAFVVGDLLHYGHLRFFRKCRQHCDYLIVGVYTDELTMTYKRKPIVSFEERIELVGALRIVDETRRVENKDATPMLKKLVKEGYNVKYLFHGTDWDDVPGKDYIESIGGELIQPPYGPTEEDTVNWLTTTKRIEKMAKMCMDEARKSS